MATEEKSGAEQRREERRKEGRKEGRGRLGVLADERIDPRRVKHGICLCLSLFLFRSSSTPPCVSRVAAALPISLSPPRARGPLLITLHGPPPEPLPPASSSSLHSSCYREPRPTAFFLIHPARTLSPAPLCLKPPFSPLLRARPRQTKTNYAAFSEPQRAPTSYATSHPPLPSARTTSALDPRLPPSTELASYVARPSSRHFPRLCPDHPSPPASETLRYVGHQMGAQPLRTPGERLVRERRASSFDSLPTSSRSDHPPPLPLVARRRTCIPITMIIVDKPGVTSKLSIPVKR